MQDGARQHSREPNLSFFLRPFPPISMLESVQAEAKKNQNQNQYVDSTLKLGGRGAWSKTKTWFKFSGWRYDSNFMFLLYMCGGKLSIIFRNHIAIMLWFKITCRECKEKDKHINTVCKTISHGLYTIALQSVHIMQPHTV